MDMPGCGESYLKFEHLNGESDSLRLKVAVSLSLSPSLGRFVIWHPNHRGKKPLHFDKI